MKPLTPGTWSLCKAINRCQNWTRSLQLTQGFKWNINQKRNAFFFFFFFAIMGKISPKSAENNFRLSASMQKQRSKGDVFCMRWAKTIEGLRGVQAWTLHLNSSGWFTLRLWGGYTFCSAAFHNCVCDSCRESGRSITNEHRCFALCLVLKTQWWKPKVNFIFIFYNQHIYLQLKSQLCGRIIHRTIQKVAKQSQIFHHTFAL